MICSTETESKLPNESMLLITRKRGVIDWLMDDEVMTSIEKLVSQTMEIQKSYCLPFYQFCAGLQKYGPGLDERLTNSHEVTKNYLK